LPLGGVVPFSQLNLLLNLTHSQTTKLNQNQAQGQPQRYNILKSRFHCKENVLAKPSYVYTLSRHLVAILIAAILLAL